MDERVKYLYMEGVEKEARVGEADESQASLHGEWEGVVWSMGAKYGSSTQWEGGGG